MKVKTQYRKYSWSPIKEEIMKIVYLTEATITYDYEYYQFGKRYGDDLEKCLKFLNKNKLEYKLTEKTQKGVDNLTVKCLNINFPKNLDLTNRIHRKYSNKLDNVFNKKRYYEFIQYQSDILKLIYDMQLATNKNKKFVYLEVSKSEMNGYGDYDLDEIKLERMKELLDENGLKYELKKMPIGFSDDWFLEVSGWNVF